MIAFSAPVTRTNRLLFFWDRMQLGVEFLISSARAGFRYEGLVQYSDLLSAARQALLGTVRANARAAASLPGTHSPGPHGTYQ